MPPDAFCLPSRLFPSSPSQFLLVSLLHLFHDPVPFSEGFVGSGVHGYLLQCGYSLSSSLVTVLFFMSRLYVSRRRAGLRDCSLQLFAYDLPNLLGAQWLQ